MIILLFALSFSTFSFDNIFGADNREKIKKKSQFTYPLSAVGLIIGNGVSACTGAFIGENLFLTASHCIPRSVRGKFPRIYTQKTRSKYDQRFEIESIIRGGYVRSKKNTQDDWALVTTKQRFRGRAFKITRSELDLKTELNLAGFSNDLNGRLGVHRSCSFKMDHPTKTGIFYHDCDSTMGASGSPVYSCDDDSCKIHGIHQGSFRDGQKSSLTRKRFSMKYGNQAVRVLSIREL